MDTIEINYTAVPVFQLREAVDWTYDAAGIRADIFVGYDHAYRYVVNNYPGGWSAFVAECCTFVQL